MLNILVNIPLSPTMGHTYQTNTMDNAYRATAKKQGVDYHSLGVKRVKKLYVNKHPFNILTEDTCST